MKNTIRITFLLLVLYTSQVQAQPWTEEEMAAFKVSYKEAKAVFLKDRFERFIVYFESIKTFAGIPKFEVLKMASMSYTHLGRYQEVEEVFQEATKHYGMMVIDEYWETFVVGESDPYPVKDMVDEAPGFPDGMAAFYDYVAETLKYPKDAVGKGIEGKVFVRFIVNKDGTLDGIQAVKGIGYGCDAEAVRVVKHAPRFIPGKHDGQAVPVLMVLPIIYRFPKDIK